MMKPLSETLQETFSLNAPNMLLLQLRFQNNESGEVRKLLGILVRGMTYDGERWRLATVGDWSLEGSHLPQAEQASQLRQMCRDLFLLFDLKVHQCKEP